MPIVDIKFNGNDLQTTASAASTILTRDILYRHLADKVINIQEDTIRDGFSLIDVQYRNKIISLSGWLKSDTAANLKTLVDNFQGYLRPKEKNLDIETYGGSGSYIRYTCTCRSINIPEEHWHITQVPYDAEFMCIPYGISPSLFTINLNGGGNIAASPYSESVNFTGSYKPNPVITITVVAETDMTAIKFENTTKSDWIQVARSFAAAEVLVIDCNNETVQVDGTDVDFTGVFPSFDPDSNSLKVTTTDSGAFNITVSITYHPTYL